MRPMTRTLIGEPFPARSLVYHFVIFDTDGVETQSTGGLQPLDVIHELADLIVRDGLSDEGAAMVFRVLAAPGTVLVQMPGGWAFQLTSEVDRG